MKKAKKATVTPPPVKTVPKACSVCSKPFSDGQPEAFIPKGSDRLYAHTACKKGRTK